MRHFLFFPALAMVLMGYASPALSQEWNPIQKAVGWSRVDRDGSCTFYEPGTQTLQTWMKDGGIIGRLDVSKAGIAPERWVLDSQGNAWIISKTTLQQVEKTGKPGKREVLPMEVGDLAWDAKGFIICYRSREPFLEKRDYKSGQVLWSYGQRPAKALSSEKIQHRIAVSEEGNVLLASGTSFSFLQIDGQKGKVLGQSVFGFRESATPDLLPGEGDRPGLTWWLGHATGFLGVPGSQVPAAKIQGLMLARLDVPKGALTFLPTGVTEDHVLIGVTETEAILQVPSGGLVFVPLL